MIDARCYASARRASDAQYRQAISKANRRYHWAATGLCATLEGQRAQAEAGSEQYYNAARDYQANVEAAERERSRALRAAMEVEIRAALAAEKLYLRAPCG